jgi:hypothetical protein
MDYKLIEGVMDWRVTLISRSIISTLKSTKIPPEGIILVHKKHHLSGHGIVKGKKLKLSEDLDLPKIIVFVNFAENSYYSHSTGWYSPSANLLKISINISEKDTFSGLVHELKKTIAHELEHYRHSKQDPELFRYSSLKSRNYRDSMDSLKGTVSYLTDPVEIPAYVAQIYKISKIKKVPFTNELNGLLSKIEFLWMDKYDKKQIENAINTIRDKWLDYAKKRYPYARS